MMRNVGVVDRVIRALVGVALIIWAATGGPVWAWVGIIPLATAAFSFCPAYSLIRVNTCCARKGGSAGV